MGWAAKRPSEYVNRPAASSPSRTPTLPGRTMPPSLPRRSLRAVTRSEGGCWATPSTTADFKGDVEHAERRRADERAGGGENQGEAIPRRSNRPGERIPGNDRQYRRHHAGTGLDRGLSRLPPSPGNPTKRGRRFDNTGWLLRNPGCEAASPDRVGLDPASAPARRDSRTDDGGLGNRRRAR
jgi:hypothetical protein